ncbi:FecR family protein [Dyadobacter aurulentus]|uniref:FecR family protein n=1 Tax=Dyadobacter sp. UC 10 TaxID=2605428 RepID=UPI0011F2CF07|nr:FecR family protein [Dyadobacter sp. UC 10]KAA0992629.1 hypothetical protein FXO21_21870 [Dyadobacter sp. UC 10]
MEYFSQYTVEELALNEAFRELVLHPTESQEQEFRQWIEQYPVEGQKLLAAADIVRAVRIEHTSLSPSEHSEAVQQIFGLTSRKEKIRRFMPLYYWAAGAAAILAVLIGFYMLPARNQPEVSTMPSEQNDRQGWEWNNTRHAKLIQLADGSSIFLKPGSAVRYPGKFGPDHRKVELQGEAFFEIAPDQSKPFFVYANATVTKVLGTSFSVRAFAKEDNTVVGVRSGEVAVSRLNGSSLAEAIQVVPGQQATVNKKGEGISKSLLRSDDEISYFLRSAANGKNIEVVHYLSIARKAFDIDISFDAKKLKSCKIRANFEGIHLLEQIDAMCKAINASYSIKNGGIVIKSGGC